MTKRAIYFTTQELLNLLYAETLAKHETDHESEEYEAAMAKIYQELLNRGEFQND